MSFSDELTAIDSVVIAIKVVINEVRMKSESNSCCELI